MTERAYFVLGDYVSALTYPDDLDPIMKSMMGLELSVAPGKSVISEISIEPSDVGRYRVRSNKDAVAGGLIVGDAVNAAWRQALISVAEGFQRPSIILHAASLLHDNFGVLIPGRSGRGKSSLTAWLMKQGYQHLSDDVAALLPNSKLTAAHGPLFIRADVWPVVEQLNIPGQHLELAGGGRLMQPQARAGSASAPVPCRLILLPFFDRTATPRVELVSPARAAMALMEQNHSALGVDDGGLQIALMAASQAVALRLVYGRFDDIEGVLQPLLGLVTTSDRAGIGEAITKANKILASRRPTTIFEAQAVIAEHPEETTASPFPLATPRRHSQPLLTIGMATYDDYDGVYFSVQALRLYHPEVMSQAEIVVIDNNPTGTAGPLLKKLDTDALNYRYVPYTEKTGSAAGKEQIFAEASGTYVLGMDCHVMIAPGAVRRLIDYFNARPDTMDLIQGPLLYDDMKTISTHWDEAWRGGMFGTWATDDRGLDPNGPSFDIPMCGMGIFACRRDAWQHFNPDFRGFGGEEGYIHEKFRQAGHRTLCLPFLRWLHRFGRPGGTPYPNIWEDRIHNYYVGHRELGLDPAEMEAHFAQHLGAETFARIQQQLGFAPTKSLESA